MYWLYYNYNGWTRTSKSIPMTSRLISLKDNKILPRSWV